MAYEDIIFTKEDGVATITLNRPKTLNALTWPLLIEMQDAIDKVAVDDEVRVLVITGAGRAFCAGDNLKDKGTHVSVMDGREDSFQEQKRVLESLRNLRKPVIAAVNGNSHGAGSDIMLACDMRIASSEAKLGDLRTRRGIPIATGSTHLLPALVGLSNAIDLLFTGKMIDAAEAERIGLVNQTVPAEAFEAEVKKLARTLAEGPTKIIGMAKVEIYRELYMTLGQAIDDELAEMGPAPERNAYRNMIEDNREGTTSFIEKRAPKFTGK
ncbi:MAG: enoyl-CoA hydratase-related protein [Desulfobacterales bacterium]